MSERSGKGVLIAALIWIIIIAGLAVAAKFFLLPYFQKDLEKTTGSESQYKKEITLALDSFSGYSVLRSSAMHRDLKNQGIKLEIVDDGADYGKRLKSLEDRDVDLAVFTVDSFLTAGAKAGKFPASIVMVIDETSGADAVIAYESKVKNLEDLDYADARIVLTPASPSEFLARTIIAHFNLPDLPENWAIEADGAEAVYRQFKKDTGQERRAYVLWEPYVSRALEIPGAHLLIDSSRLKGYIVDVLVAERTFLRDHPDLVRTVIESYFRAAHSYSKKSGGMETLVIEDAKTTGSETLNAAMAKKLVDGIQWKNTLENNAPSGSQRTQESSGLQHIEDVVLNITDVLLKTGAITSDPLDGKANTLYYDAILDNLQQSDFHPGKTVSVIEGLGSGTADLDKARVRGPLKILTDAEWNSLMPVGRLRVKPIAFARGTARLNIQSNRDLAALAKSLGSWPDYYLLITGNVRAEGDPEANLKLAGDRAAAAAESLLKAGVSPDRIKNQAAAPSGAGGSAQSVTFQLMQLPY